METKAETTRETQGSALSGILLVGGTAIGAGMLALPVATGMAGFVPAIAVNLLCWLAMMATGLLLMEATLWMEQGANLLSMADRFMGRIGKYIVGVFFVFLYYCLLVSYIAGGTPQFVEGVKAATALEVSGLFSYLAFSLLLGAVVYCGHRVVDRMNWLLMISLILSYFLLIGAGSGEVNYAFLQRRNWGLTMAAAPILFSAYGYHNIVPSLAAYLRKDVRKLRLAIVLGTAIPFLVYSFWQWMILGSIPEEQISQAAANGVPITYVLQQVTGNHFVSVLGAYFGFFALVTSFLGVSLSMVDFFYDGFKHTFGRVKKGWLCLLVFFPPAIFAAYNPGIFVEALGVAGGLGETVLNGLIPIMMVWVGRYRLKLVSHYRLPGGKLILILLALFTLLITGIELLHLIS